MGWLTSPRAPHSWYTEPGPKLLGERSRGQLSRSYRAWTCIAGNATQLAPAPGWLALPWARHSRCAEPGPSQPSLGMHSLGRGTAGLVEFGPALPGARSRRQHSWATVVWPAPPGTRHSRRAGPLRAPPDSWACSAGGAQPGPAHAIPNKLNSNGSRVQLISQPLGEAPLLPWPPSRPLFLQARFPCNDHMHTPVVWRAASVSLFASARAQDR